jgi:hypothetical protein
MSSLQAEGEKVSITADRIARLIQRMTDEDNNPPLAQR